MSTYKADKATPTHSGEFLPDSFDGGRLGLRVEAHDHSTRVVVGGTAPAPYGPDDNARTIVEPVMRRINELETRLGEVSHHDRRTGAPVHAVQGSLRDAFQRELDNLRDNTLPHAQRQAAAATAYHASQPSQHERMAAQVERRAAIADRAQEIVDEEAAKEQAAKITATNRRLLGIG
jgi:hypothetical protein